jgi:hypothetical protein
LRGRASFDAAGMSRQNFGRTFPRLRRGAAPFVIA